MNDMALFFAGAFLCNCIPHLASGLRGESFPTPFARPRGVGLSSPLLNVIWGTANGVACSIILIRHGAVPTVIGTPLLVMLLGFIVMGVYLSTHFGKVRQSLK